MRNAGQIDIILKAARDGRSTLDLSESELDRLPREIGLLTKLRVLLLKDTLLQDLPPELGSLISLQILDVSDTPLSRIPSQIGRLRNLRELRLQRTGLKALPLEIDQLSMLRCLDVSETKLTSLPSGIGKLEALEYLDISATQIRVIPPEIGNLHNLQLIDISNTKVTALPSEIRHLLNLKTVNEKSRHAISRIGLILGNTPLIVPPLEVVYQGIEAIRAFFIDREEGQEEQWISKLLIVGQGGVGKTSLLRRLRREPFDPDEYTTHGIEVGPLFLDHPERRVTMTLNTWDFGGQEIYHATHQFFLTNRSLFLIGWNARSGYDEGRVQYWLDTIQARAPESPIILVATHTDQRPADIPFRDLQAKYPQLKAKSAVSNLEGTGIDELRQIIANVASGLPLMGETWPKSWREAAEELTGIKERHISPSRTWKIMETHGVPKVSRPVLAQWLHDLGEILYFVDDEELREIIILEPQWVTTEIYKVLDCDQVIESGGVFRQKDMSSVWGHLDNTMRLQFLRLMERFDLSYRTGETAVQSLVVERLPFDPPDYETLWNALGGRTSSREVAMRYELNTLPPGIPTWFIARVHRFSSGTLWRRGALFQAHDQKHVGLVRADEHAHQVSLAVRGPYPGEFFALLKDGLEWTINRYPGLRVSRYIPCPGHRDGRCTGEFELRNVLSRLEKSQPKTTIECPVAGEDVGIAELLYGWHPVAGEEPLKTMIGEIRDEIRREFEIVRFREEQKIKTDAPSLFVLWPKGDRFWAGGLFGINAEMRLCCEAPGQAHPILDKKPYRIPLSSEWLKKAAPTARRVAKVLKVATPFLAPGLAAAMEDVARDLSPEIKVLENIVKMLPSDKKNVALNFEAAGMSRMVGSDLRVFHSLLEQIDRKRDYQGLERVLTPEGHYFWLCPHHAKEYKP